MGYRSQVALCFEKKAFFKHVKDSKESFKDADIINVNEDCVLFIWEHVKWYDSYADVIAIEKVMDRISFDEELMDGDYFGFVRVGEETGHIETKGDPFSFEVYPVTYLETSNFGGDEVSVDDFFKPNSVDLIQEGDGS
jgi:hypothetical protein